MLSVRPSGSVAERVPVILVSSSPDPEVLPEIVAGSSVPSITKETV